MKLSRTFAPTLLALVTLCLPSVALPGARVMPHAAQVRQATVTPPPAQATMPLTALVMPWTDDQGDSHAASAWVMTFLAVDVESRTARVVFSGYKDAAALVAHAGGKPIRAIGQHDYSITGDRFLAFFGGITGGQMTLSQAVFSLPATVTDTPRTDAQGQAVKDADGKPVMRSAFEGAARLTVSVPVPAPATATTPGAPN